MKDKVKNKKNILFINHSGELYGAETVLVSLLSFVSSQKDEYNVHIVYNSLTKADAFFRKVSELPVSSITKTSFRFLGGSMFRNIIILLLNSFACFKTISLIKKHKIDIIYTNSSLNPLGIVCAILTQKKHIWHFHEPVVSFFGWTKSTGKFHKMFLKYKKNTVVFISNHQKADWEKNLNISIKNYQLIYNPIKKIEKKDKPQELSDTVIFGFIGSANVNKNVSLLINVFSQLEKETLAIKLKIVEKTPQQKDIEKQINELGIKNVEIADYCFDISSFYASIDVLVLPSFSEMMPLVVLEAMSVEKAVIVTEKTGLHEILTNNVDCIFINPFSETDLYQAMKKMLNAEFRQQLAKTGFEKTRKIDFNNTFYSSFDKLFKS